LALMLGNALVNSPNGRAKWSYFGAVAHLPETGIAMYCFRPSLHRATGANSP